MMVKRVAITQQVMENPTYPERRDALAQDWIRWFAATLPEHVVLPVPNTLNEPTSWLKAVAPQALILTGGNDWGEAHERDRTELSLVRWFRQHGKPILGVCRGLHVVNIALGGTLCTNIAGRSGTDHVAANHKVALAGELFQSWAGASEVTVNSYHNQGVISDQLAEGLKPFAIAAGAVVEGCIHADEPILAMQWHPERPSPSREFDQRLITTLFSDGGFWKEL